MITSLEAQYGNVKLMSEMAISFLGKSYFLTQHTLNESQEPENVGILAKWASEGVEIAREDGWDWYCAMAEELSFGEE